MAETKIKDKTTKSYDDATRMGLRGTIRIASEINAAFWPMRSFVSNNPLHSLEYLDFEEAVNIGLDRLGAKGYLSNSLYRDYYKSGRILPEDLDYSLRDLAKDDYLHLGKRQLKKIEVLRASLLSPLSPPTADAPNILLQGALDASALEKLVERLKQSVKVPSLTQQISLTQKEDTKKLGHQHTLSQWCDAYFGTEIVHQINQEMIKWCGAFLDEGQAPWEMPDRKNGFYTAWKKAMSETWDGTGICNIHKKIDHLSDHPEDAVLESLEHLGIPNSAWETYLSYHLSALPGWTAFSNWRSRQSEYEWQQAYPINLLEVLAVRLWYEGEWISKTCEIEIGSKQSTQDTCYHTIREYLTQSSAQHFFRKARISAVLPTWLSEEIDLLLHSGSPRNDKPWEKLASLYEKEGYEERNQSARLSAAWRLSSLALKLQIDAEILTVLSTKHLTTLLAWIDDFPESRHGPYWLVAFEMSYQRSLINKLRPQIRKKSNQSPETSFPNSGRPLAQAIFCIDVRSEPFRRQLEQVGHYETFGFAGFFASFIRYRAFGSHHETDLFPVVMEAKNVIHEIPRVPEGNHVSRHLDGSKLLHAGHTLFHDLKENVITPYVMVESIGWFFAFPFFGKTFWPVQYADWVNRLMNRFAPPIETRLSIDKKTKTEVEELIAAEQCVIVRGALEEWLDRSADHISDHQIETLRNSALNDSESNSPSGDKNHQNVLHLFDGKADRSSFIEQLSTRYHISPGWSSARMEQLTRTGYTLKEQAFTVETGLRVMGLTQNFASFVLLCGHGSSNENNPFEAALDCGACGGNPGGPNARVFASMANKPAIRKLLAGKELYIPEDTWFIAAQHDTTTDAFTLFDLEDLPSKHHEALSIVKDDLKKAAMQNNAYRCRMLPDLSPPRSIETASKNVQIRSRSWNQVRPEWGLSGNAAFIIGHRALTKDLDLGGRVFLHSYDTVADPEGTKLEIIMTGPLVVTQWISMGYYFSIVDNEIYGSGNKIYHNVTGNIGIMYGPTSDLRIGLPWQTVTKGNRPYHEPMRLCVLIEATRAKLDPIIKRHRILQNYFHNRWVNLVAMEADVFYQYLPSGKWVEYPMREGENV